MKRIVLITLLLAASAASLVSPAAAQDAALVTGFADGFTFHSHTAANRKIDSEATIDEQLMPAFKATAGRLKGLCSWR